MSGCEEEASAIEYGQRDALKDILDYINLVHCGRCEQYKTFLNPCVICKALPIKKEILRRLYGEE